MPCTSIFQTVHTKSTYRSDKAGLLLLIHECRINYQDKNYDYHIDPTDDTVIEQLGLSQDCLRKLHAAGISKISQLNRYSVDTLMNRLCVSCSERQVEQVCLSLSLFYCIPRSETDPDRQNIINLLAPYIRHMIMETSRYLNVSPLEIAGNLEGMKCNDKALPETLSGIKAHFHSFFYKMVKTSATCRLYGQLKAPLHSVSRDKLIRKLPDFFQEPEWLDLFLHPLMTKDWVAEGTDGVFPARMTLHHYVNYVLTSNERTIFSLRCLGMRYMDIAKKVGIPAKDCGYMMKRILMSCPPLREDFYLTFFNYYSFPSYKVFHLCFPEEDVEIYNYLYYLTRGITDRKRPPRELTCG